ncbi:MAG: NAD(P)H-dependent glycerol-3-phosphate dehydrogenase [Planctomycetota bacterium]
MSRAAVLGAGSWGTALALHLSRTGTRTRLWARSGRLARSIAAARENADYLAGHLLPGDLEVTADLPLALRGAELVLFVVPAQFSRVLYRDAAAHLPAGADLVIASKGIEADSLLPLSAVLVHEIGRREEHRIAALSGPSFAVEVARGDPTAVVVAGPDGAMLRRVQDTISRGNLRAYRNGDRLGVEAAGALKNVVALATGIAEGIGLGCNARAALITRGMVEMTRLGVAMGGRAATFAGLAGAGDLILTCTGALSRNRSVGLEVGRGRRLDEVLGGMRMVAEGVSTVRAAVALADRHGVEMPIAREVHAVLFEGRPPRDAVAALLARPLKEEA